MSGNLPIPAKVVAGLILAVPGALPSVSVHAGDVTTIHVDASANGPAVDGSTWCNAFRALQDGLAAAEPGDTILVANGEYRADQGVGETHGDRLATFRLHSGVAVRGGFAGCGAAQPDARDVARFETVLSGDLNGDDDPAGGNNNDNSFHVVTGSGVDSTSVLDGVTIVRGNANPASPTDQGGGLFSVGGSPTLINCTFSRNIAFIGGAVYCLGGEPTFVGCVFLTNFVSGAGGAMYLGHATATLTGCHLVNNTAGGFGGGLYATGSRLTLTDCTFQLNDGSARGGGLYNDRSSTTTIKDCAFTSNTASDGGAIYDLSDEIVIESSSFSFNSASLSGGAMSVVESGGRITDCDFANNVASDGGAVHALGGAPIISRSTFSGNRATSTGGAISAVGTGGKFSECIFTSNTADNGGGIYNLDSSPRIDKCTFSGNTATFSGGAVSNVLSAPLMTRCLFANNGVFSISGDGGAIWNLSSSPAIFNSTFRANGPAPRGGAVSNLAASPTFTNCLFSANAGGVGGAMFNDRSDTALINCTLFGNTATLGGGTFELNESITRITNSILWNNAATSGSTEAAQVYTLGSVPEVNHTCVEGLSGALGGIGNIGEDPDFVDPEGVEDFRLRPASPCNDAGDNAALPADDADLDEDGDMVEPAPLDLLEQPRLADDPLAPDRSTETPPVVDMGAFEHKSPVRFVDGTATGANSGRTWSDAYDNLRDALRDAEVAAGETREIWVATGTYSPADAGGNRSASFHLLSGVSLYGGFLGGETHLDQRDPMSNPTLLSGDLDRNDGKSFANNAENSLHVVIGSDTDMTAVLDGFTIIGGNADENCDQCFGTGGGGMLIINGSPTVRNCTFMENSAQLGGAMVINGRAPTLSDCRFIRNRAFRDGLFLAGGALAINGSEAQLMNCDFIGNTSTGVGAAVLLNGSNPEFMNCVFTGNTVTQLGPESSGGGIYVLTSTPSITNCTFSRNFASASGGGLFNALGSTTTLTNCILWGNSDSRGSGEAAQVQRGSGTVLINFCAVQGWSGFLGGTGNTGIDPRFVNADGKDSVPGTADDDLRLSAGSPVIDAGDSTAVPSDIADLDVDGNRLEPVPVDAAGHVRFVDDPLSPDIGLADIGRGLPVIDIGAYEYQPDCNRNGIIDADDIASGHSPDCNQNGNPDECDVQVTDCDANGMPDDCQVPQFGSVESTWIGNTGMWGGQAAARNWCLPEVPNNNEAADFDVVIGGDSAHVVLNVSPTLDKLTLLDGATVSVGAGSGANVRTIAVDEMIVNSGALIATDGKRLVIDAPVVDQTGGCTDGGVLEAISGGEGEKSVLEINGAVVLGGVVRTTGTSEIHLIGGAELVDVCSGGVVVPDGQVGSFSGTLTNNNVLVVRGTTSDTRLEPTELNAVLGGTGCVRLTSQAFSRLGDFKTGLTNSSEHSIEGAGIILGGVTNDGVIRADLAGEALILFPPGTKLNSGVLAATLGGLLRIEDEVEQSGRGRIEATDGGTVLIHAEITGTGGIVARGGTVLIVDTAVSVGECIEIPPPEAISLSVIGISASTLTATDPSATNDLAISGGRLTVADASHVAFAGPVRICPVADAEAILELANSSFSAGTLHVCAGGTVSIQAGVLTVERSLVFLNVDETEWTWDASSSLQVSGGTGLPSDDPTGYARLEVAGTDRGHDPEGHVGNPKGFVWNFAHPELIIGPGAHVSLVDREDNGNRIDHGFGRDEALFVNRLTFSDGAGRLNVNGLHLYYEKLAGAPDQVIDLPAPLGDDDADGDTDLWDFAALQNCFATFPLDHRCRTFDYDDNSNVDHLDHKSFVDGITGPNE